MPTSSKLNIYLGTGREGLEREETIKREQERRGFRSTGAFIWYCIAHLIECEKVGSKKQ